MEKVLEVFNKGNYIRQYEDLVSRYPKAMYSAIDSLSLLTFLIPGRFGDAEIISEGSYILCNLLQLYHGRILDRDRVRTGGLYWAWRASLTVLQEAGVLAEMLSLSRGGEKSRWRTITIIEVLKLFIRARVTFAGYITEPNSDVRILADGGRYAASLASGYNSESRQAERRVGPSERSPFREQNRRKMSAEVRRWKRSHSSCADDYSAYGAVRKHYKRLLLLGESFHMLRPLVYVSLRKRFGGTSWVPWLSSCILDLLSIRLSSAAMQGCQKNDVEVSTTDVNTSKQSEIQRRYMVLLMYFMRDPLYGAFSETIAKGVLGTFARIPLLGIFFGYFLEMLDYMKRYYFFWASI